jgi:hypothetical protein
LEGSSGFPTAPVRRARYSTGGHHLPATFSIRSIGHPKPPSLLARRFQWERTLARFADFVEVW